MKVLEKFKKNEIKNYIAQYSKVYIYGAGAEAKRKYHFLKGLDIKIDGFVVTAKGNNSESYENIPIRLFDTVIKESSGLYIVGVSDVYKEEILKVLNNSGVKNILDISSGIEIWKKNISLPKLEITAQIGCKIQCKYCPQELFYSSYFKESKQRQWRMSYEEYKLCVEHMPSNTIICFAGFVEPFFHPQGVEMIQYAYKMGHPVELFTTFMGLTKEQFDIIKHIPFHQVVLHTPDKLNYANIQIDETYRKILDEVLDMTKEDGTSFIDSANCQSEPSEEFLKLAKNRIVVESTLVDRAGNLEDDALKKSEFKKGKIICNRTKDLNHWVLLPDGTVVLCCMDFGLKHPLGNLLTDNYDDIIAKKEYQSIISAMSDEKVDIICRKCTSSKEV